MCLCDIPFLRLLATEWFALRAHFFFDVVTQRRIINPQNVLSHLESIVPRTVSFQHREPLCRRISNREASRDTRAGATYESVRRQWRASGRFRFDVPADSAVPAAAAGAQLKNPIQSPFVSAVFFAGHLAIKEEVRTTVAPSATRRDGLCLMPSIPLCRRKKVAPGQRQPHRMALPAN